VPHPPGQYKETPPFPFVPQEAERPEPSEPGWGPTPPYEKPWGDLDTPAFIRKNHSQLRKMPS
jgi:hypothetical protein